MTVPAYTTPTYVAEVWNVSAWEAIPTSSIRIISGGSQSSGSDANGLSFGVSVSPNISIDIVQDDLAGMTFDWDANWKSAKLRVKMGYVGISNAQVFVGLIRERTRSYPFTTFVAKGFDVLLEDVKLSTAMTFRRPVATYTSAGSIDDPTDPAYAGGTINQAFWTAGGRPLAQKTSYEGAAFYYACDQASIAPEFSWFSGENLREEVMKLAQAAGGQVYQDAAGTLRYVNPLNLAGTPSGFHYTAAHFAAYPKEKTSGVENVGTVVCPYVESYVAASQEVYSDTTEHLIGVGQTLEVPLEMSTPMWSYECTKPAGFRGVDIVATMIDGRAVPVTVTVLEASAQRLRLSITNGNTLPVIIRSIKVLGEPLATAREGVASAGSGTPERRLPNSVHIQSQAHAEQLTAMVYDFYAPLLPVITLETYFDGDRFVGETVLFTFEPLGYSSTECRIVNLRHDRTGQKLTVDLVPIGSLPTLDEIYLVGTTDYTSQSKRFGY